MVGREGFTRRRRLCLVAVVLFTTAAFATVAFADTVTADADVVTVGTQTNVNLGTVAPGESIPVRSGSPSRARRRSTST